MASSDESPGVPYGTKILDLRALAMSSRLQSKPSEPGYSLPALASLGK